MARIDYCDPAKHNERTRELLGKNRNANIFRMMAHGDNGLAIGDEVTVCYQQFAGRLVPYFEKAK